MFQNLYPDEDVDSAYQIDYQKYYDQGYRGILFDVDNTLVEHNQPVTLVAIELFQTLNEMGFKTCIISNNRDERVNLWQKLWNRTMSTKQASPQQEDMYRE